MILLNKYFSGGPLLSCTFVESCYHVIGCRFPDPLRAVTKGLGDDAEKESHDHYFFVSKYTSGIPQALLLDATMDWTPLVAWIYRPPCPLFYRFVGA